MKVSELVAKLLKFPEDMEVLISDGYVGNFYSGNYDVLEYKDEDNQSYVDIGIGGLSQ